MHSYLKRYFHTYIFFSIYNWYQLCSMQHFGNQIKRQRWWWRKRNTPPTCTKGFGHQPCEAGSDFSSIKIIMIKGLDGRNNESVFRISHVHSCRVTSSTYNDDISPKEFNASNRTFAGFSLIHRADFVSYMCQVAVQTHGWAYFHIYFGPIL